jgi:hypothetical protein
MTHPASGRLLYLLHALRALVHYVQAAGVELWASSRPDVKFIQRHSGDMHMVAEMRVRARMHALMWVTTINAQCTTKSMQVTTVNALAARCSLSVSPVKAHACPRMSLFHHENVFNGGCAVDRCGLMLALSRPTPAHCMCRHLGFCCRPDGPMCPPLLSPPPQLLLDTPGRQGSHESSGDEDDSDYDSDEPVSLWRLRRAFAGGGRRPIDVRLRFGRTEVTATAKERSSGRCISTAVKFAHS